MGKMSGLFCRRGVRGQGMTEYLIIVALIAIAAIGVYSFFGQSAVRQPPAGAAQNPQGKAGAKDVAGAPSQVPPKVPAPPPTQIPGQSPPAQPGAPKETGESKSAGAIK